MFGMKIKEVFLTLSVIILIESRKGFASPSVHGLIMNCEKFTSGQWPWMVALIFKENYESLNFFCGP